MRKTTALRIALVVASVCLTLLALELAFRIRASEFQPGPTGAATETRLVRMDYHPRLGWIPRPGRISRGWTSSVDASGVRSNGTEAAQGSRPTLAVGDSFAFGYEVEDHETWAAYLEGLLNAPVLNAGTGAYGIDQAFLRAELLLEERNPSVVILSFISADITRAEFSYYAWGRAWKPYFHFENGALVLRNVPVPQGPGPKRPGRLEGLRTALHHSRLAWAVLDRVARRWWRDGQFTGRVHDDGEEVSAELLARLDGLTRARGGRFVAVALAANEKMAGNRRIAGLVTRARAKGVDVLDLASETTKLEPRQLAPLFTPGGHYAPEMNRQVAERIAAYLQGGG